MSAVQLSPLMVQGWPSTGSVAIQPNMGKCGSVIRLLHSPVVLLHAPSRSRGIDYVVPTSMGWIGSGGGVKVPVLVAVTVQGNSRVLP